MLVDKYFLDIAKAAQGEVDIKNASPIRKFILNSHYSDIGEYVAVGSQISRQLATTAVSICRRRFKIEDIILIVVLDEEEQGEAGIAFTEKGICHWKEDEEFVAEIPYDTIKDVDYDEENVIVTTTDGKCIELFCNTDADEKYNRYMYNFILDVKEAYGSGNEVQKNKFSMTE